VDGSFVILRIHQLSLQTQYIMSATELSYLEMGLAGYVCRDIG
jgi:hypothetical protein